MTFLTQNIVFVNLRQMIVKQSDIKKNSQTVLKNISCLINWTILCLMITYEQVCYTIDSETVLKENAQAYLIVKVNSVPRPRLMISTHNKGADNADKDKVFNVPEFSSCHENQSLKSS